jgi:hypothetical protein
LVYVSVYNSYEVFLVRGLALARGESKLRTQDKKFKDKLRESFGDPVLIEAWTDPQLNLHRLVRHCLTHAGGKLTPELRGKSLPVEVVAGAIHVVPQNIRDLYAVLKNPALSIASAKCFHTPAH